MKKAILVCSVLMTTFALRAEYLNWQVTQSEDNNAGDFSYAGAQLGYVRLDDLASGETLADLAAADKTTTISGKYPVTSGEMASPAGIDLATLGLTDYKTAYAYYIELINSDNSHVAYGETLSYSELAARGYVTYELPNVPTVWHGGTYNAVPEPTGALLMVFGLAFLALKRRTAE